MTEMNVIGPVLDEYRTVVNRDLTYAALAFLLEKQPVVIAWTDEEGTQFDILLVARPLQFGPLQRGLRGHSDLFVGIMGIGCHAFEISKREPIDAGYIASKYRDERLNITFEKVVELINGIIKELAND